LTRNKGDWGVDLDAYLAAQEGVRETELLTINVTPEQEGALLEYLLSINPGDRGYSIIDHSCVTVCENALESVGILSNEPGEMKVDAAGNLIQAGAPRSHTPSGLVSQVTSADLVKQTSATGRRVSWLRAAWGTLKNFVGGRK
jgi:hypothetical protein